MNVAAGPFPGSPGFEDFRVKRSLKNKLTYKGDSFKGHRNPSKPQYKELKGSLSGEVYKLPSRDYKELVSYLNKAKIEADNAGTRVSGELSAAYKAELDKSGKKLLRRVQSPGDYIDFGFDAKQKHNIDSVKCDGGHIREIDYNAYYKLMRVRFEKAGHNGDTVVFFDLPANIATTLMYLGRNGTMASNGRHAVGVEFWNLVRVRETIHETRFTFAYTSEMGGGYGSSGGTQASATKIANTEQERAGDIIEPTPEEIERANQARTEERAMGSVGGRRLGELFDRNGEFYEWMQDKGREWKSNGEAYMSRLYDDANKAYQIGDIKRCKDKLLELARSDEVIRETILGEDIDSPEQTEH